MFYMISLAPCSSLESLLLQELKNSPRMEISRGEEVLFAYNETSARNLNVFLLLVTLPHSSPQDTHPIFPNYFLSPVGSIGCSEKSEILLVSSLTWMKTRWLGISYSQKSFLWTQTSASEASSRNTFLRGIVSLGYAIIMLSAWEFDVACH